MSFPEKTTDSLPDTTTPNIKSPSCKQSHDCQHCVTLQRQIDEQKEKINQLIAEQQRWELEQQQQEKSEQFWMMNLAFLEQKWKWLRDNMSEKRPRTSGVFENEELLANVGNAIKRERKDSDFNQLLD